MCLMMYRGRAGKGIVINESFAKWETNKEWEKSWYKM